MRVVGNGSIRVADPPPPGGKHHEHQRRQEAGAQRQVHEQLPRAPPRRREQAPLYHAVAERHRQEHQHRQDRVHVVRRPQPVPPQVVEHLAGAIVVVGVVVEDVEAAPRGEAVVQPAVAAGEAVGEGEQGGGGGAEGDEGEGEGPARGVAGAAVGEGGREGLEGEYGAGGKQLGKVRHRRQRLASRRRGRRGGGALGF